MHFISQRYIKVQYAITLGSLIFLFAITCLNNNTLFLDESVFVKNMPLFKENGLSKKFLTEMYDQAPGPLYQIVQSLFEPLTNLKTPGIRLVNVFLFILIIINISIVLRFIKTTEHTLLVALNLTAIPVIWQVAGMALTEIPAMFFATLSFLILGILLQRPWGITFAGIGLAILGGVCLGASILGRTPYLMLIPAVTILAYNPLADKSNRQALPVSLLIIYIVTALIICLPIFFVWKGLVPPQQAIISQGGLKIWHGVLAFAYAGIIALLITPQWFKMNKQVAIGLAIMMVAFTISNLFWFKVKHQPLYYFLSKHLPENIMNIYPIIISPALMVFAVYFSYTLLQYIVQHRNDTYSLSIAFSLAFVLTTCVNITHLFASRYVAQAAPFLVIIMAEKDTFDRYKIMRLLAGIVLGYISLQTYV